MSQTISKLAQSVRNVKEQINTENKTDEETATTTPKSNSSGTNKTKASSQAGRKSKSRANKTKQPSPALKNASREAVIKKIPANRVWPD